MSYATSSCIAVGIDVAKATLSVCLRFQDGNETALCISNTETDIMTKVLPRLEHFQGKIVLESTGHYHWLSTLLLTEAGFDVRVINPILGKKYTSSSIRKVKTDKADASLLARMALVEEQLPPRFTQTRKTLKLRKRLGFIASLAAQIQALKAMAGSLKEADALLREKLSPCEGKILETIKQLEKETRALEREFERDVKANAKNHESINVLTSIPGVSAYGAAVMVHLFSLERASSVKSWIAFAGLDVSVRESGTWQGHCRLTKRGNGYLRRRLFGAAWGAMMHDNDFRSYYQFLRDKKSRTHVEALTIIARKLVSLMYHLLKSSQMYDPNKVVLATG